MSSTPTQYLLFYFIMFCLGRKIDLAVAFQGLSTENFIKKVLKGTSRQIHFLFTRRRQLFETMTKAVKSQKMSISSTTVTATSHGFVTSAES